MAAIAFPGQGGDWMATIHLLRAASDHPLVIALAERLGTDRWSDLDRFDTRTVQPAVYVAGLVGPASSGSQADIGLAMGHSLGEITAAAWAGAIEPVAGLDLILARGQLGHARHAQRPGAMAAVNRWDRSRVEWLRRLILAEADGVLEVAVTNSPTQIVLSGDTSLVVRAAARANADGAVARVLPIGGGYHSPLLGECVGEFRALVRAAVTAAPRAPVLSSTSQEVLSDPNELVEALTRSLVLPVDWPGTIAAAVEFGATRAIEAGPGDTLSRLARYAPQLEFASP